MLNYTDYNYTVQVRIDSDSGELVAFVFGAESGEIGLRIKGHVDLDAATMIGRRIVTDARRAEHGWPAGETLEDHA